MKEKEELQRKTDMESASSQAEQSIPPMGFKVIIREFKKDKVALFCLTLLVLFLVVTTAWYIKLDADQVMRVDIFRHFAEPAPFNWGLVADAWNGEKTFIFGADEGGRDIFQ